MFTCSTFYRLLTMCSVSFDHTKAFLSIHKESERERKRKLEKKREKEVKIEKNNKKEQ